MSSAVTRAADHRALVRSLYGAILRAAKHFPSVKRDSIIRSIKEEFRANAALELSDPKVAKCLAVAERGRSDLEAYKRAALSQGASGDGGAASGDGGSEVTIALKGAAHHHSDQQQQQQPTKEDRER
jgi:hypothetical protein